MKTLEEAWGWYDDSRRLLRLMKRLASKYWSDLPLGKLERDENFKTAEEADIVRDADAVLAEFDDVAVFVLFSVFEAMVRDHVLGEVSEEATSVRHPALVKAAEGLMVSIEEGSFYNNV